MRYGNIQINNFQAGDLIEVDVNGNLIPSGVPTQSVVDSTVALSGSVDQNTADIQVVSGSIDINTLNIDQNTADIQVVSGAIDINTLNIDQNTTDIQVLSGAIDDIITEIENPDIDTGTATVDAFSISTGSVEWLVCVRNGNNIRTQKVLACVVNSTAEFTSITTQSVGDTSDLTLAVDYSGGQVRLRATAASNNWAVKVIRQVIEI